MLNFKHLSTTSLQCGNFGNKAVKRGIKERKNHNVKRKRNQIFKGIENE